MIKKLRIKFILISAISVFFVLFVTIFSINLANYISNENYAKTSLVEIINNSYDPVTDPEPIHPDFPSINEKHYFVVQFSKNGSIKQIDNRQMFFLTEEECAQLAIKVYKNESIDSKYENFRYLKETKSNGTTYVAFIDLSEKVHSFNNFLLASSLISAGSYTVFVGLIIVASKIAFKTSEEAFAKQKVFITNASHELKTPLTIISADLDLIEMDNGKSEWSQSIRDELKRLTTMTNQLVTLSKFEENDYSKLKFETFSVSEICSNAVNAYASLFSKENIKFTYDVEENITMNGSSKLLDELIHIFLDNSLKYTDGDNKFSSFKLHKNSKGKIELNLSNSIDKNDELDVKQIMGRFYRSPTNKKEGSGIGLSIAQEIINFHKGKINITKADNSLVFVITFKNL